MRPVLSRFREALGKKCPNYVMAFGGAPPSGKSGSVAGITILSMEPGATWINLEPPLIRRGIVAKLSEHAEIRENAITLCYFQFRAPLFHK